VPLILNDFLHERSLPDRDIFVLTHTIRLRITYRNSYIDSDYSWRKMNKRLIEGAIGKRMTLFFFLHVLDGKKRQNNRKFFYTVGRWWTLYLFVPKRQRDNIWNGSLLKLLIKQLSFHLFIALNTVLHMIFLRNA
jgi:hypothetical protein